MTSKPRITVSFDPAIYSLIQRLAGVQRVSMSHVVSEMIETVAPSMERVAVVLEAALTVPKEERANILAAAERAERAFQEIEQRLLPPPANRGVKNGESMT